MKGVVSCGISRMLVTIASATYGSKGIFDARQPIDFFGYSQGWQPPKARFICRTPAIDTGASARATQRRATRNQRRNAFQNAVAIHGSARQARRVRAAMTHGGT